MGKQIQIAFNECDEREAHEFLLRTGAWLSLPYLPKSQTPVPVPLGKLDDETQMIFPAEMERYILSHLKRREPREWIGETAEDVSDCLVYPTGFAFIEWTRSRREGATFFKGRYYLETASPVRVSEKQKSFMERNMRALASFVRAMSPLRTRHTLPIYVGAHLARDFAIGKVTPCGDLAEPLIANVSFKETKMR